MQQQRLFICQHCQHALTMPRAGMSLREARSWFRYATCPACKRMLRVVERVPEPVVPVYTQPQLWGEEPGEHSPLEHTVQSSGAASAASAATGAQSHATP